MPHLRLVSQPLQAGLLNYIVRLLEVKKDYEHVLKHNLLPSHRQQCVAEFIASSGLHSLEVPCACIAAKEGGIGIEFVLFVDLRLLVSQDVQIPRVAALALSSIVEVDGKIWPVI